ncbi:MAG: prenyltransferase, partial [Myxococcota bacterium]
LGVLFVLADLLYIVFLNDWADADVDRIKRSMFPDGCSPKTIPDRILSPNALLAAGACAGLVGLAFAFVFGQRLGRPLLGPAAVVALAVFWAYTLPPFRLNYRGGGELLEAFGVGGVLPWLNAYAQSGEIWNSAYALLFPFVLLSLSSAVASGLSDERSDVEGGKRTIANTWGNTRARRVVEILLVAGAIGWALTPLWVTQVQLGIPLVAAAVALAFLPRLLSKTDRAVTDAFREQGLYKQELHRAIWWSATAMAALFAAMVQLR